MEHSEHAKKILNVVSQSSNWLKRSDIARLIGKKKLNPYEVQVLEIMAAKGLIDRKTEERPGVLHYQYLYRGVQELPVESSKEPH